MYATIYAFEREVIDPECVNIIEIGLPTDERWVSAGPNRTILTERTDRKLAAMFARQSGIPVLRTQITQYEYGLDSQKPIPVGDSREFVPSRGSTTDLGIFSGYLEEILDKDIYLVGQSPDSVEGYCNQALKDDIFERNTRPLTIEEIKKLSPLVSSKMK
ncbi:MAG: hypothetical protein ACI8Y7_000608 [Candidatus Woesearchaeota archaeon]|jgi:hypothetical protein